MFVLISAQYILWLLSETEGIVYSKLLMRAEQEKEEPREGRGLGGVRMSVDRGGGGGKNIQECVSCVSSAF